MIMKKTLAFLMVFVLLFSFAGCKGKKDKETEERYKIDVEYYAKLGQFPECDYSLGTDVETLKKELSQKNEKDPDNVYYDVIEGEKRTAVMTNGFNFYYDPKEANKGINCIAALNGAYGFEQGTVSIEIKKALSSLGFESAERDLLSEEIFFMPNVGECTCLEYEFGNNAVKFVFNENALCAAVIYSK